MQEYINNNKIIQKEILSILTSDQNGDEIDFDEFVKQVNDQKVLKDENEFRLLLHLISSISQNHHRSPNFFSIIEKILLLFKDEYKKYLTNSEIFYIFYGNIRIILTLFKNGILELNEHIANNIYYDNNINREYFFDEIKPLLPQRLANSITQSEPDKNIFEKNRQIGENDQIICEIIRNDKIDDFIVHMNKHCVSVNMKIPKSVYETNFYLRTNEPTLIEYATFYGSIQIFNYLQMNNADLTPSLWFYAVHSKNPEMIHLLERYKIEPEKNDYQKVYKESLLCHHNEVAEYIKNCYLDDSSDDCLYSIISSYNYELFPNEKKLGKKAFCYFCQFDYFYLVKSMLDNKIDDAEFHECINDNYVMYYTPFLGAVHNNSMKIVKLLLDRPEIDINSIGIKVTNPEEHSEMNALRMAIFNYNIELAELLLNQEKINVNSRLIVKKNYKNQEDVFMVEDVFPVSIAISYCDLKMAELFLKHKEIDVNIRYKKYMVTGHLYNDLLYDLNELVMAFSYADNDMVKLILTHPNLDVNSISQFKRVDEDGTVNTDFFGSFLCILIMKNCFDLVKILLENPNVDVNSKLTSQVNKNVSDEKPALYLAVENKNEDIVKELLKHKEIDVNCKYFKIDNLYSEHEEKTVLQLAFEIENENIIRLLLANPKIDVNAKSSLKKDTYSEVEEKTTLSYAINCNVNIEIIKLLLENPKLNIKLKDKKFSKYDCEEKNILQVAKSCYNHEMFNFLLEHLKQLYNKTGDKQIKNIISPYLKKVKKKTVDEGNKSPIWSCG